MENEKQETNHIGESNKMVKKQLKDLTDEEKIELAKKVADIYLETLKSFQMSILEDFFTPFWVKWYRKLKQKISRK